MLYHRNFDRGLFRGGSSYLTDERQKELRKQRELHGGVQAVRRPQNPKDELLEKWKATELSRCETFYGKELGNPELPIYVERSAIKQMIRENKVSILAGETGSGKTTQIAQYALEAGFDHVVYLMPRRIIVDNIAERLERELSDQLSPEKMENMVGQVHSECTTANDDTRIQVMTAGSFVKKIPDLEDKWKDKKVLIVVDEIHEAEFETESAAALAIEAAEHCEEWRVNFASATPDLEAIQDAYRHLNAPREVPVIEVKGRPHDLSMGERPDDSVVDVLFDELGSTDKAIIFTDGKRSIDQIISKIYNTAAKTQCQYKLRIHKLHAKIGEEARKEIFDDTPLESNEKVIIVSTSAGQSGITIPGINLVISDGLTKTPELDQEGVPGLPLRHCSQAELKQQAGRGGRDIDGARFFLATPLQYRWHRNDESEHRNFKSINSREKYTPPGIYSTNISRMVLAICAMGKDFGEFNDRLIHGVDQETQELAKQALFDTEALDDDYKITEIGLKMDKFALRPELARAVVESMQSGCDLQIRTALLAIATSIEAGGLADHDLSDGEWKCFLGIDTKDDFMAQYDLFVATRPYFYGDRVDDEKLIDMGIDFKNAYRAHKQFNKMCKAVGVNHYDVVFGPICYDDEKKIKDLLLTGMLSRLYEHNSSYRDQHFFKSIHGNGDTPEREISKRSILDLGGLALKNILVAGYPWWYDLPNGEHHDIIETGFTVDLEQIREMIGHMSVACAIDDYKVEGDGYLRQKFEKKIGNLVLEIVYEPISAETAVQQKILIDKALESSGPAQRKLRDMKEQEKISQRELEKYVADAAQGKSNVHELDNVLWDVYAAIQSRVI